ncbi:DUF3710 domain-containing protein [Nocardioides pantholopis]|uniref:DUF3710 domain-containing protein n=1 Tax=Nocardioides pantholopis TaxID=2483798 RepID=UPI000F07B178|nr:DUF3710 domain-containing protein [Nocardioides pantholopis]
MKFRRKSDATDEGAPTEPAPSEPAVGPFDVEDLPADDVERVDLGSLLVAPLPDRELRLQVNEQTGAVQAVLLAGPDGALEVRAFAAPRNGDLWAEVRPQIAADMAQRGGTATEREGRFGPELVCQMPVRTEDGKSAIQPSRIVGVNGPRWLLRATLMGRPALEEELPEAWAETIASLAVRRGTNPMPVGESLPIVMPENARRVPPPAP